VWIPFCLVPRILNQLRRAARVSLASMHSTHGAKYQLTLRTPVNRIRVAGVIASL
jgi:hypothetical protein